MNRVLFTFVLVFGLFVAQVASALDLGAQVGVRVNKSTATGYTSEDKMAFQAGALIVFPIVPMIGFRTGGLLVQRDTDLKVPDVEVSRLFLDIPLTVQLDLPMIRAYAGADLAMKMDSSCSAASGASCTLRNEESTVIQPVVGLELSILPFISLGVFFEPEATYQRDWKQSAFGVTGTFML